MMKNKVVNNATWIIACRIVQALLGLVVSMLSARYLGPGNFGLINYASSIVAFVAPVMQLGLNNILVREYVNHPEDEGTIVGTTYVLTLISALACMTGVISFAFLVNSNETLTIVVCSLYSLKLIFQATELIQYWFQAKYLSKYVSIISLCAYAVVSAYKIFLLAAGKDVRWFAISNSIDFSLISLALFIIYKRLGGKKLSFSPAIAKRMLMAGRYYILSGLMVVIFAQTDKIMLKLMINETETGYYSAATACISMTSFVFSAIIDSMRPSILAGKLNSQEKYERNVVYLYSIIIYLALGFSLVETIFAPLIIRILYGSAYAPSVNILRIIVWYSTFGYYGGAKDVWILAEQKQKYLLTLNLSGAITNVFLNAMLIPRLGASGAAIASLLTQFFTNIVMGFVIKELRPNNVLMLKSINPRYLLELMEKAFGKKTN